MAGIIDGEVIGLEEGLSCLPSHILDEAFYDYPDAKPLTFSDKKGRSIKRQNHRHPIRSSGESQTHVYHKSSSRPCHMPAYRANWAPGGDVMQAIFLDRPGEKQRGTGVFLPRNAGTGSQSNRKADSALVLLPSRVVRALNLNVHELGLQISPHQGLKNNSRSENLDSIRHKIRRKADVPTKKCSSINSNSLEIFLPKEWTY